MWCDRAQVEDVRGAYLKVIYQNYEAGKQPFIDNLPALLAPLEKLFKGPYVAGAQVRVPVHALFRSTRISAKLHRLLAVRAA